MHSYLLGVLIGLLDCDLYATYGSWQSDCQKWPRLSSALHPEFFLFSFFFLMDFFANFFMPKWGNLKYSNWNVKLNNSWKQHFCAAKSSVRSATCDKLQWGVSERSLTPHEAVHESGPDFTLHKIIVLIYEKQKCV